MSFSVWFYCPACGTKIEVETVKREIPLEQVIPVPCPVCQNRNTIRSLANNFNSLEYHSKGYRRELEDIAEKNRAYSLRRSEPMDCMTCKYSHMVDGPDGVDIWECGKGVEKDSLPKEVETCWRWESRKDSAEEEED